MFTGLITHIGKIVELRRTGDGARLLIESAMSPYQDGESIAVNGVCLTVSDFAGCLFGTHVSRESLERTNLGELHSGCEVNLERALRLCDRLGGHIVSGHVDTTAKIAQVTSYSSGKAVVISIDESMTRYIVEKGSIAIDGASLTVNRVARGEFEVMLIPHTQNVLCKRFADPGRRVNIEVDVLGKYVEKLVSCKTSPDGCIEGAPSSLSLQKLRENGFC